VKALCWHGKGDARIDTVPDPRIEDSDHVHRDLRLRPASPGRLPADGGSFDAVVDKAKATVGLATDRAHVLRETIMCCRKGGTLSIPGVYVGLLDKIPFGALMNKGLTVKAGQTHVQRYGGPLLKRIEDGEIDPSFVITHKRPLDDAP
jgi:threonine dehydrogenase-like Zn-dependent dehydrogenase